MAEKKKNTVDRCVQCGMCRNVCPVFKILKDEKYSPRGKAFIVKEKKEIDYSFYECSLCGACYQSCYNDVLLPVKKKRAEMIKKGKETEANKKMIENVRKYGNPFGKVKKGDKIDELYCC